MKAALFSIVTYQQRGKHRGWPAPADGYSAEVAQASMESALAQFVLADELGFDWVTVAEHHFSPASLTPNPMVMAAAVAQRVKRAKIALLGSNIPIQNPVRVAEEFAILDTLSGGRLIAGMLRGTSNEYVTYGINPAESRAALRMARALLRVPHHLDLAAPRADATSSGLHVDLEPGGGRVRGGASDQRWPRCDDP